MKFARVVFIGAGVWGIAVLTPLFFLFDYIGRQGSGPITYPQFYYGFVSVGLAWQFAFLVIGSNPARFRLLMIPSAIEKFGFVICLAVLYMQARVSSTDAAIALPDFLLGILFLVAFAKTPSG